MKPGHFHETSACRTVNDILTRVGDKWTVLVVSYLGNGPMRFNALRRTVNGISQKMLTTTLRNLERDGFVTRTRLPNHPAKSGICTDRYGTRFADPGAGARRVGDCQ